MHFKKSQSFKFLQQKKKNEFFILIGSKFIIGTLLRTNSRQKSSNYFKEMK